MQKTYQTIYFSDPDQINDDFLETFDNRNVIDIRTVDDTQIVRPAKRVSYNVPWDADNNMPFASREPVRSKYRERTQQLTPVNSNPPLQYCWQCGHYDPVEHLYCRLCGYHHLKGKGQNVFTKTLVQSQQEIVGVTTCPSCGPDCFPIDVEDTTKPKQPEAIIGHSALLGSPEYEEMVQSTIIRTKITRLMIAEQTPRLEIEQHTTAFNTTGDITANSEFFRTQSLAIRPLVKNFFPIVAESNAGQYVTQGIILRTTKPVSYKGEDIEYYEVTVGEGSVFFGIRTSSGLTLDDNQRGIALIVDALSTINSRQDYYLTIINDVEFDGHSFALCALATLQGLALPGAITGGYAGTTVYTPNLIPEKSLFYKKQSKLLIVGVAPQDLPDDVEGFQIAERLYKAMFGQFTENGAFFNPLPVHSMTTVILVALARTPGNINVKMQEPTLNATGIPKQIMQNATKLTAEKRVEESMPEDEEEIPFRSGNADGSITVFELKNFQTPVQWDPAEADMYRKFLVEMNLAVHSGNSQRVVSLLKKMANYKSAMEQKHGKIRGDAPQKLYDNKADKRKAKKLREKDTVKTRTSLMSQRQDILKKSERVVPKYAEKLDTTKTVSTGEKAKPRVIPKQQLALTADELEDIGF